MRKVGRRLLLAIAGLSALGVVLSAVALQRHYARSATSFCEVSETFNCDTVNRSEYSRIAGIPVAAVGLAGYGVMFVLAIFHRGTPMTATALLLMASAGLAFALYLTYAEAYVLRTWCILCLGSLAVIFTITLLAFILRWSDDAAA